MRCDKYAKLVPYTQPDKNVEFIDSIFFIFYKKCFSYILSYGNSVIYMSRKGPVVGYGMLDFVRIVRLVLVLH